ncbi:class I SAM-dependent methyltransferase [Litchfieldia salsa]|uniref:Trans-aconitate methyltransferase n=1 Tax=Litchfieldia salsa TaxID=930152 RepID=A0A1H0SV12_9BACI|nr:class I SAM-dependent methyltransferase [Litchfieldia salsa]SDP45475.1 Trans-aconitate methyltransferase [Litchfieldia salsa]
MYQKEKDGWNANLYDGMHSFVSEFGNDLVNLLNPKKDEKILDIGCGTGDLANRLHQLHVHVVGIDKSENMVCQASAKYPNIEFKVIDVLDLNYKEEFDAVFSNASLHWVKSPKLALQCIYHGLASGGRFVAELGGKGNVQQITDAIMTQFRSEGIQFRKELFPWYFPSIGEYSTLMEEVGFEVTLAHHFDRPTPLKGEQGLKNWIEMFAGSMFEDVSSETKERMINNVENHLKDCMFVDGNWIADYKRIRVVATKE